jgi:PepSY-associated TM region
MRSRSPRNLIWQTLVVLHRYLGVAVGLLMVMWFASGIVMMYVDLPRVTDAERARTLEPIAWQACCRFPPRLAPDNAQLFGAQVENVAGAPVMRLRPAGRGGFVLDLEQGAVVRVDAEAAREIALDAAPRIIGHPAKLIGATEIESDQWTLGRLRRERPLFRFAFDNSEKTNIYVSGSNAEVVHWTTATERFWSWLGTIPHWLYFAQLRSNVVLWTEIMIWTSVLGTFLTVLGLYLGITQFTARFSPYRGWFYWHHIAGLVFGITTLTFVVSGLISMNPWGFLEDRRGGGEQGLLEGGPLKWGEVRASLNAIRAKPEMAGSVSLATAPFAGQLYWLVTRQDGIVTRLDAEGGNALMSEIDLAGAAKRIAGDVEIAKQALISEEDAYYLRDNERFVLPVYRVVLKDGESTRYYIDPQSGALLQRADATARWYRWLFGGLHRIDFTAWMRARPAWDIIMLTLMLGGLALTTTGFYLALRRIRNDIVLLSRFIGRGKPALAERCDPVRIDGTNGQARAN